jgi:hypothetical protein
VSLGSILWIPSCFLRFLVGPESFQGLCFCLHPLLAQLVFCVDCFGRQELRRTRLTPYPSPGKSDSKALGEGFMRTDFMDRIRNMAC